ncbi:hypothetical protein [Pseudanabaena sp. CCNP1317]|uniref:hypothetical protein n=1 Tax=Pseudanabaena sp. CCNP1317 TaxID=3110253 RepID=UPI002B205BE1|nr:hypothetical protein [Pseudanabaena sp. CCNP1317]MEA5486610.1 hypothetical protein [Pseudanabaena sp. CCNP1317]
MSGTGTLWLYTQTRFDSDWEDRLSAALAELGVENSGVMGSVHDSDHEPDLLVALDRWRSGAGDALELLELANHQGDIRFSVKSMQLAWQYIASAPRFYFFLRPNAFSQRLADYHEQNASPHRGTLMLTDLSVFRGAGLSWTENRDGRLVVHDWCRWRFGIDGSGWLGSWDYEAELIKSPLVVEWRAAFERQFGAMDIALNWGC